jgi:hypothetical protein
MLHKILKRPSLESTELKNERNNLCKELERLDVKVCDRCYWKMKFKASKSSRKNRTFILLVPKILTCSFLCVQSYLWTGNIGQNIVSSKNEICFKISKKIISHFKGFRISEECLWNSFFCLVISLTHLINLDPQKRFSCIFVPKNIIKVTG